MQELKGLGNIHLNLLIQPALGERLDAAAAAAYEVSASPNDLGIRSEHSSANSSRSSAENAGVGPKAAARPPRKGPKKTQLALVKEIGSVAVVKMARVRDDKVFDSCNLMIRCVSEVASQTDGTVGSLHADSMVVSWNTAKNTRQHVAAAMRFVSELKRRAESVLRVGIATGKVLHGNVGTKNQRYHNIFGPTVKAAEACSALTRSFSCFALVADCSEDGCLGGNPCVSAFIRIVDVWWDMCSKQAVRIYQIDAGKFLAEFDNSWGMATEDTSDQEYKKAYYAALQGDEQSLGYIKSLGGSDSTLMMVYKLLSRATLNENYRVKVKLGGPPSGIVDPDIDVEGEPTSPS
eukprot:TRINITY_DN46524_c0_g1_i1.p1 TRINITY_DN46524_c0_g1~~TRINITY_DN46524_c0_g1_i1.p1  ORF type:complete len:380 (+),score=95.45 TRINITY_DN46524_c0_g1_i1:95-1141(+)